MNKFYVPKSKKGTNRRASDESSPSLEQAMKNEIESSAGIDVSPELPKKENVVVEEMEAKEETKKEDNNQEKRVSWDVDLEDGEDQVELPNEIDEQQSQLQDDQQQQPIFKFNYHPLPHEKEYYEKLCSYARSHNSPNITTDIISPGAAAKLFITSGIPSDRLRMIWNMSVLPAAPYPPGTAPPPAMTFGQFYASVRLIQLFQNRITAKDEMLRVDEEVDMSPAYFAGVSGVLIPLPDEDAMLPPDFGEGVPPTTVVPSDSEATTTPQVSNKKQNGMINEGTKEDEPPKKRVSGALRSSTKLRNSVAGEEKMRRNSTINERSHQARRATDPDSVDPKSSVSRSITGALASVVEDNADKVNIPSENAPPQSQKEKDQEYNNKVRRRRSSLGDENEKIIWTRAMKRMSSIGAGSAIANSASSDEAMRRRSSAFPPIMSVGAQAMQDEAVVAYDGAENEYFMSQGEYLTYQGTFSRHCVTEVVGDHAEQYVYVEAALALFEKSGLNRDTIGKLWDVVVLNPDAGKLNEIEFVLLTHLIVCCTRRNLKEPTVLPVPLRLWRENQITPKEEDEVKQNDTMPLKVEVEASEEASYVPNNTVPTSRVEVEASEEVSYVPPPPANIPTRNTVDIEPSEEVSHVSPNGVTYQYKSKTSSNSNKSLSSEDHRYKRMEKEIRSLASLVGSLTTEIHDLKGMMQQKTSPTSVTRMASSHPHNGIKNGAKRTSRGRAAPQAATSVPVRKPKPYEVDEDAPNEEVEMYWGDKNDDTNDLDRSERSAKSNVSTKKWKCDVGCDAVFDDYNICLAHERTCQGGNRPRPISPLGDSDPYSQPAAPPKRLTASERLRISREKKEETKRNLRLSRNVPSFHPSSLPSSSAPRSQMNRSMPQSRVDMARDAGNGVARSMMMNGAPQQHQRSTTRESMMRNLRQGNNNASFRPAKLQPISKKNNRQPGLEDISERSTEQEQSPVPAGILKGGKNYLDVSERSATSRTSYSRSMPVNNTSPSSSGMPPRPKQMNKSMPNPSASQTMSEIEHRRLLAEQFKVSPQEGPGNLASQMQQVQREEQFDNLMQTTLNRFGSDSVNGSITSGSAAPSMNRGPNRHQQNDLNASFKPVKLNRSRQLRQQQNLGASVRHVYRRKSGTTEAYKATARKSTMALDLPPLS